MNDGGPNPNSVVVLAVGGSRAHGTHDDRSDLDVRGVWADALDRRLTLRTRPGTYEGGLTQALWTLIRTHGARSTDVVDVGMPRVECALHEVAKFLSLAADANPGALELLFTEPTSWLVTTDRWRVLYDVRHRFLTRRVGRTFLGYAQAQLRRIEAHRGYLLDPPSGPPRRETFGLPLDGTTLSADDRGRIEAAVRERVRAYGLDRHDLDPEVRRTVEDCVVRIACDDENVSEQRARDRLVELAEGSLGLPSAVVSVLAAERRYRGALRAWDAFKAWEAGRNPARAALERAHGFDTKHAMHLVRIMRMAVEAIRDGEIRVMRADAAELRAIRDGKLSYAQLVEHASALESELHRAMAVTELPERVDDAWVDELFRELVGVSHTAE